MEWLFAYGSLQPGCWNYRALEHLEPETKAASVPGRVYWMYKGSYPYAVLDRGAETLVHGTLIRVDTESGEWGRIYGMEIGAGYHLVDVMTTDGDEALAFDWMRGADESLWIPSGDWRAEFLKLEQARNA